MSHYEAQWGTNPCALYDWSVLCSCQFKIQTLWFGGVGCSSGVVIVMFLCRSCSGSHDVPKRFSASNLCASWIRSTGSSLCFFFFNNKNQKKFERNISCHCISQLLILRCPLNWIKWICSGLYWLYLVRWFPKNDLKLPIYELYLVGPPRKLKFKFHFRKIFTIVIITYRL